MRKLIKTAGLKATEVGVMMGIMLRSARAQCDPQGGIGAGAECAQPVDTPNRLFGGESVFRNITNVLIFIVGAVAVLMLIVGGLRYVLSSGNATNVEAAKNTIFYAIIGIIVAILAFAIVNFVIGGVSGGREGVSALLLG